MTLTLLELTAAVCRLAPNSTIPDWALLGPFYSITRTPNELAVVCDQKNVPADIQAEKSWKIFKVEGVLDFSLTGILSSIANPLAAAKISIFAISTFDTDYIMVKAHELERAQMILQNAGFEFTSV